MNEHLAQLLPSQSMDLVITTLFAKQGMGGPPAYAVQLHRATARLADVATNTYKRTNGRFDVANLIEPLADSMLALCILARLRLNKEFSTNTWDQQFHASDRLVDGEPVNPDEPLGVPNTRPIFNPDVPKAFSLLMRLQSLTGSLSLAVFAASSREHYEQYRSPEYANDLFRAYAYIRYLAQFHNLQVEQLYWVACGLLQKNFDLKFRMEDLFTDPNETPDSAP